jgi:ATP-dependent Lon protease
MTSENTTPDTGLDELLNRHFPGKVVRKDLTKLVKEGANVPVYVLEYLLGSYCASNDETVIEEGLRTVKKILAENYVRPDEAEKVKSTIRERGSLKVIDKVTVTLNEKRDVYEALLGNLGVKGIEVPSNIVKNFEKLLVGGIWCIVTLEYFFQEDQKGSPFVLRDLKPIQMPNMDLDELFQGRRAFTEQQWTDALLRSTGMEPTNFPERVKWHLLARMIPLVENNFNLTELGPRGTGKSHIYKEISPNSILVSGGQTTVANLFYNMARRQVGLVGLWDVVAFDEVAGISFKDKDGVQIMKDYMASGSFARGRDSINAYASMVFVGNINQSVDTLVKTSHLFAPFPETMIDSAFFDRFHAYIPGWEIPKMRPEFFTNQYGLIVDYLAEWLREMRKRNFGDAINKYFKLAARLGNPFEPHGGRRGRGAADDARRAHGGGCGVSECLHDKLHKPSKRGGSLRHPRLADAE